jgi:hypothetical protein
MLEEAHVLFRTKSGEIVDKQVALPTPKSELVIVVTLASEKTLSSIAWRISF